MKVVLVLMFFLQITSEIFSQGFNAMTYNIRYDNPEDSLNSWAERKSFLSSQIDFNHPDIIGMQEVMANQLHFLDSVLTDYNFVGVGREDGQSKVEFNPIFYNAFKFIVIEQGTFWLSDTPDSISVGWDAALPRICTYALLHHHSSDRDIWVFNTHFDHVGEQARLYSADIIMQRIDSLTANRSAPIILMGDFNTTNYDTPDTHPFMNAKLADSKFLSKEQPTYGPHGTFNNFEILKPATQRIDYIFVSEKISVLKYGVLTDSRNGKFPSDHFPVLIEVELFEN